MSNSLEKIVRPFAPGEVFTRSRILPRPDQPVTVPPDDVVTSWQGAAESDYIDEGNNWYNGFTSDLKEDRTQRVSRTVEVQDQNNPDNKVFIERIDKTVFKDEKGKATKIAFDWSAPQDGP